MKKLNYYLIACVLSLFIVCFMTGCDDEIDNISPPTIISNSVNDISDFCYDKDISKKIDFLSGKTVIWFGEVTKKTVDNGDNLLHVKLCPEHDSSDIIIKMGELQATKMTITDVGDFVSFQARILKINDLNILKADQGKIL